VFNYFTRSLGQRYALSRDTSHLVSFISRMSVLGLIIGVALLLLVMSIMNGFDRELRERILRILPQVSVLHSDGIAPDAPTVVQLSQHPQVLAASPFVRFEALLTHRGEVAPVGVLGVDVANAHERATLQHYLAGDSLSQLEGDTRKVILGRALAEQLKVASGQRLTLVIPRRAEARAAPELAIVEVVDIFDSGTEIDNNLVIAGFATASALSSHPGRASGVRLQLTDLFQASAVSASLAQTLPYGYHITNWTRTHGNLYQAIQMSKRLVSLLMLLLIGIAAFNLVSTLIMVVVDKQGDIAILRTLGASTGEIIAIFLTQGGLIGALGTLIGLGVGVCLSLTVMPVVALLEQHLGIRFLQTDVYPVSYLPSQLMWQDIIAIGGSALLLSLVASLYPAWRASRVLPAEALRYE